MTNDTQGTLFDKGEWWEEEWQGMPEFKQENLTPFHEIVIKFRNREDMDKFMVIAGQKFTMKTNSIWYPKLEIKKIAHLRWVDES